MTRSEIAARFTEAVDHQRRGRHCEALALYDAILRDPARAADPAFAPVHANRGTVLYALKRHDGALAALDRAIALNPDFAEAHNNRGNVLRDLGRAEEALSAYDRAAAIRPNFAEAHYNKGALLAAAGRTAESLVSLDRAVLANPRHASAHAHKAHLLIAAGKAAEAVSACDAWAALEPGNAAAHGQRTHALRLAGRRDDALAAADQAVRLAPGQAALHNERGIALAELGRLDDAVQSHERAIALDPRFAEAHNNRGIALVGFGRMREAQESFARAVALAPGFAEAHSNLGNALHAMGQADAALAHFDGALALAPAFAEAHANRGNVLKDLGRLVEALAALDRALELAPGNAHAHSNRGLVLQDLGRTGEALAAYDAAIVLNDTMAEARTNKGMCLLSMGHFDEGWPLYEWRVRRVVPEMSQPEWLGRAPIAGKTLLIDAEQGLGDTIQFARYAALAEGKGAHVILRVQPALVALMTAGLGAAARIISRDEPTPPFDFHIRLLSMPFALGTRADSIPARVPYLRPDPVRAERWAARIGDGGFRIGIAWQGDNRTRADIGRSFPLRLFAPLASVPGVRLISLQKHAGVEQLESLPSGMKVETLGDDFDSGPQAFVDAAAVMQSLDLVISPDTAVAHLAGALARPVWIVLKHQPDWRWLLEGTKSPWYPTAALYRQPAAGDWDAAFATMEGDLRARAASILSRRASDNTGAPSAGFP